MTTDAGGGSNDMQSYINALMRSTLFEGIREQSMERVLGCLRSEVKRYPKGIAVLRESETISHIAVVISGAVQISKMDSLGEKTVLRNLHAGDYFGQAHACSGARHSDILAHALTEAELLWLNYQNVFRGCSDHCEEHFQLIENLNGDIARENLELFRKIGYMTIKSMRRRIYAYLLDEHNKAGSAEFEISYDRTALANYLNVDRSALSRELSRMRQDGLVDFHKNSFTMLRPNQLAI